MKKKAAKFSFKTIVMNKHSRYEYFIEEEFESGIELQGWEVKSLRVGNVNINSSYVILKNHEVFLLGASFTPMSMVSPYYFYNPTRNRKLLLNQREINYIHNCINHGNYTIIPLSLYWKCTLCKLKIGVAKGKKIYDKRTVVKEREWQLNKARIMKNLKS